MGNDSSRARREDLIAVRGRPQPSAPDLSILGGLPAEVLPRRERDHELGARAGRREDAAAQPIGIFLPEVCYRHNSRQGCTDADCRRLHICRLFLADICRYRSACRYGHSLTTVHNQRVCNRHNLDTARELVLLQQLRRAFDSGDKLPDAMYRSNLERCFKYCSRGSCLGGDECNRLHLCRDFVIGNCGRAICRFGHDLHTTHNNRVLSRHRVTRLPDSEILEILREKERPETQRVTGTDAASSSTRQGAIPRQRHGATGQPSRGPGQPSRGPGQPSRGAGRKSSTGSGGAGREASAAEGISDELQCPVCLDLFNTATTLGCGHTFCAKCLRQLRDHNGDQCPTCRTPISSSTRSVALDNIVRSMAVAKQ